MDASLYTLIGALGGVFVTQAANFLLEGKKGTNQLYLKKLEIEGQRNHELSKERRIAYAKYLETFDYCLGKPSTGLETIISPYYAALILASDKTKGLLNASFQAIQDSELEEVIDLKHQLHNAMQNDIEI